MVEQVSANVCLLGSLVLLLYVCVCVYVDVCVCVCVCSLSLLSLHFLVLSCFNMGQTIKGCAAAIRLRRDCDETVEIGARRDRKRERRRERQTEIERESERKRERLSKKQRDKESSSPLRSQRC